jgi:hypothetical protein
MPGLSAGAFAALAPHQGHNSGVRNLRSGARCRYVPAGPPPTSVGAFGALRLPGGAEVTFALDQNSSKHPPRHRIDLAAFLNGVGSGRAGVWSMACVASCLWGWWQPFRL